MRAIPVSRALAKNQRLEPRYLCSELQALVREGILKAVRGPHGGYVLAREQRRITAAPTLYAQPEPWMTRAKSRYPDRH
jgi:DNA-binding IscR family transcriptional regulator